MFLLIFVVPQVVQADILALAERNKAESLPADSDGMPVDPPGLQYSYLSPDNNQHQALTSPEPGQSTFDRKKTGISLMLLGTAVGAVGALYKFGGDDPVTILCSTVGRTDKEYTNLNYAMMIGGGALLIVGIILSMDTSSSGAQFKSTYLRMSDEATQIGVCLRF